MLETFLHVTGVQVDQRLKLWVHHFAWESILSGKDFLAFETQKEQSR